jgi:hypothetical protein
MLDLNDKNLCDIHSNAYFFAQKYPKLQSHFKLYNTGRKKVLRKYADLSYKMNSISYMLLYLKICISTFTKRESIFLMYINLKIHE